MSNIMPAVEVIDGKPVVSSLKVAEHFGKSHRNLLPLIDGFFNELKIELVNEVDHKIAFNERNFAPIEKLRADFFAANFFPATYQDERNRNISGRNIKM